MCIFFSAFIGAFHYAALTGASLFFLGFAVTSLYIYSETLIDLIAGPSIHGIGIGIGLWILWWWWTITRRTPGGDMFTLTE